MGKPSSLCFPPEPGEMTALGWCWSLCTTAALIFLGAGSEGVTHRQPIWRACFFPAYFNFWAVAAYYFPIELAAVVLCYTFNASSVCTCLFSFFFFNLLSQAAEGDGAADWDRGVSFLSEKRLHRYLCLDKESKQEDTRCAFSGGGWRKMDVLLLLAEAWFFCTAWFYFAGERSRAGKGCFLCKDLLDIFPFRQEEKDFFSPQRTFFSLTIYAFRI